MAAVRVVTPSLWKMLRQWNLTVSSLTHSAAAMALLRWPSARHWRTVRSAGAEGVQQGAGGGAEIGAQGKLAGGGLGGAVGFGQIVQRLSQSRVGLRRQQAAGGVGTVTQDLELGHKLVGHDHQRTRSGRGWRVRCLGIGGAEAALPGRIIAGAGQHRARPVRKSAQGMNHLRTVSVSGVSLHGEDAEQVPRRAALVGGSENGGVNSRVRKPVRLPPHDAAAGVGLGLRVPDDGPALADNPRGWPVAQHGPQRHVIHTVFHVVGEMQALFCFAVSAKIKGIDRTDAAGGLMQKRAKLVRVFGVQAAQGVVCLRKHSGKRRGQGSRRRMGAGLCPLCIITSLFTKLSIHSPRRYAKSAV